MNRWLGIAFLIGAIACTGDGILFPPTPGSLDISLDHDGRVTTSFGNNSACWAVALQPDGKIVAAGAAIVGLTYDIAVARYFPDGSLDPSFGTGGKVTTPIGPANDLGYAVAIQPDGKIVVAGYAENGTDRDFAVARYNADGSLDTTFDVDGIVTTPIGAGDDTAWSVALQADGKIVAAGHSNNGSDEDFAVVRYTSDGSLDTAFDGDGIAITPIGADDDEAYSVAIQGDGKIVVAGTSESATDDDIAVVRYNADGSLDIAFDSDGKVTTAIGSGDDYGRAVAIQADGKIVVAGDSRNASGSVIALVRYNADGPLDTTFSGDGIATTSGSGTATGYAVAIRGDGRIVVAGAHFDGSHILGAVARFTPADAADANFSDDGWTTTDFTSNSTNYYYAAAALPDGRTLAAGYSIDLGSAVFALARYW